MPYRKSYRRPTSGYKRRAYGRNRARSSYPKKSTTRRPVRFQGQKTPYRYKRKSKVSNMLSSLAETELKSFSSGNVPFVPQAFGNIVNTNRSKLMFNLGHNTPNGNTAASLKAFSFGVAPAATNTPIKSYYFIKKNTLTMQVFATNERLDTISTTNNNFGPLHFRVLIVAAKTNMLSSGPLSPNEALWLNTDGKKIGFDSAVPINSLDMSTFILNRKNFMILKDQRFRLAPPVTGQITEFVPTTPGNNTTANLSSNVNLPSSKIIRLDSMINRKVYYGSAAGANLNPHDLNDNKYVIVLASNPVGTTAPAPSDNWKCHVNSVTSYYTL